MRILRELGAGREPDVFEEELLEAVHSAAYLDFLRTASQNWASGDRPSVAVPHVWRVGNRRLVPPKSIFGQLGYFSFDSCTPIAPGTWKAAVASANTALTAQKILRENGEWGVFALTRPPGHHACSDRYGGYCFLNNAAIAAAELLKNGARRVAILDVDYHHGNGTQEIFYRSDKVLFISIHADPDFAYPYFSGYGDETGEGDGEGWNANFPLNPLEQDVTWAVYEKELHKAITLIRPEDVDYLIVSLGVDTFAEDGISEGFNFHLRSDDFWKMGRAIGSVGLPTLFLMEGGYNLEKVGVNVGNVLRGFEAVSPRESP